jgi:hypothetical protein
MRTVKALANIYLPMAPAVRLCVCRVLQQKADMGRQNSACETSPDETLNVAD